MTHNSYVQFFQGLATAHKDIRHNEAGAQYPTGARKSFFRANKFEELAQSLQIQADVPMFVLNEYTGGLSSANELLVDDTMVGGFMILQRADNADFSAIDTARDNCKRIGQAFIAEMHRQYLDLGRCGPIDNFSLNSVRYEFAGPLADDLYGCIFYFNFGKEAYHINTIDLDTEFQR